MKSKLLALTCTLVITTMCFAQTKDTTFKKQWKEIDSLLTKAGLPKTALARVDAIYQQAIARKLEPQVLKAISYKIRITSSDEEKEVQQNIVLLEKEIAKNTSPVSKSVLQVMLANQYETFYQRYSWKIRQRRNTTDLPPVDFTTWTYDDFTSKITDLYTQALANDAILKRTPTAAYSAILTDTTNLSARPTMYDIVAHAAIDYNKKSTDYFIKNISDTTVLAPTPDFIRHTFKFKDSTFTIAAKLFQQLLLFHQKDENKNAFVAVDIERLTHFKAVSELTNESQLFVTALTHLAEQHPNTAASDQAWYLIAKEYVYLGDQYSPFTDTANRYEKVKAKQLLESRLSKAKESAGKQNMLYLLEQIKAKSIHTATETVNIPNKPFRLLLRYTNVDTVFMRLYKIKAGYDDNLEVFEKLSGNPAYKSYYEVLPATNDYQNHSIEFKIDALPAGDYLLLTSSGGRFDSTDTKVWQRITVSSISYIQNNKEYFVLNRETGQPLRKVKVKGQQGSWNGDKYVYSDIFTEETDANGFFKVNNYTGNIYNIKLNFFLPGDTLMMLREDQYYRESTTTTKSNKQTLVSFFTDRGIYRPGQTVCFKGIITIKDYNNNTDPEIYQSKDSIMVQLRNAQYLIIDSMKCAVNEFGSITGKFRLPANTITGQFSIQTKRGIGSAYFAVEEYKRPTFSIAFDTLSKPYKLNDSITVTGKVMSYAQTSINNASIKYTINRSTSFPYPWKLGGRISPYSRNKQIASGNITSNPDGTFSIRFKALADSSADKKNDPVFNYTVSMSATDANGETREGNTTVRVGYRSFLLLLTPPAAVEAQDFRKINVFTKNMAGKNVPATVSVSLTPLDMLAGYLRERKWDRPDTHIMDKASYKRYFPHDEYDNESDELSWPRKASIFQETINTGKQDSVKIEQTLTPGYYIITAITKDESGEEIKDEQVVKVYNDNGPQLSIPAYSWQNDADREIEAGDSAKITIGSSAPDVFVIAKFSDTDKYDFYTLNNSKVTIGKKMSLKDPSLNISYAYVKDNQFFQGDKTYSLSRSDKQLTITYASFRNKTLPGSKETWTINVKNKKGEKAAAELLTAMYDASLDQFRRTQWAIPNLWSTSRYYPRWNTGTNFYTSYGMQDYLRQYTSTLAMVDDMNPALDISSLEGRISVGHVSKRATAAAPAAPEMMKAMPSAQADANYSVGAAQKVSIRGNASITDADGVMYVVDGELTDKADISPDDIKEISVLKGEDATALYGAKAAGGVVVITTKRGGQKAKQTIRRNFSETAFFFPEVYADTAGNYSISFTMPEALTQWKWMALAHTKGLAFAYNDKMIITQKDLMAQLNLPRFLRNGDKIELSAKISNTGSKEVTGQAHIQLINPETNQPLDGLFQNVFPDQYFTVAAGQSSVVKFPVTVPYNFTQPVICRVTAQAGDVSDGEEYTLPILSNRILVTESLPFLVKGDTTAQFTFTKLANNQSESLTSQNLTVEYTPNPVWSAVQALPYLSEYPYECAEQTFNRFYANALASYIVSKSPALKAVFSQWLKDTTALQSPLEQNPELKQILLQETPWVLAAGNEAQQRKNIAMLFDIAKMSGNLKPTIDKLKAMQLPSGGFPWFKDGREDRYITQYILTGIARLTKLNAIPSDQATDLKNITTKALKYADREINNEYDRFVKSKLEFKADYLSSFQIQYLYMRSYFGNPIEVKTAYNYYYQQAMQYWQNQSSYFKAMIAFTLLNTNQENFALTRIIPSIEENAVETKDKGMYWKDAQYGYYWYNAPIEQQALLIELSKEVAAKQPRNKFGNKTQDMQTWLILQKQTNNWKTTKATADACYALLLDNKLITQNRTATVQLGNYVINGSKEKQTAGSGYFKTTIAGDKVQPSMGDITVTTTTAEGNNNSISYGAVYWQYFEDIDKVTASSSPLSVKKKLFIEVNNGKEKVLAPVAENQELKTGDKIVVRLELRSDRDMEYIHLKDMRAAGMEPTNVLSSYKWQDGLGYYEATKDASTNFFFNNIHKGTYIFDYSLYVTHTGTFSSGIATVQCMYAPEFISNSEAIKVSVK